MRQTTPRRAPEKRAASANSIGAEPCVAGDHLDLGITVTVYRADSVKAQQTEKMPGFTPADPGFTEH
jgi:hypothetical protein